MSGVGDSDLRCSLSDCSSGNAAPRPDGLLTAPLQQISYFVSVNLHVRAKQLWRHQPFGLCYAASSFERSEGCRACARGDSSERMHGVGGGVGGEGGRGLDGAGGGGGGAVKSVGLAAASGAVRHDQAALAVQKRCNGCIGGVGIQVLRLDLQASAGVRKNKTLNPE